MLGAPGTQTNTRLATRGAATLRIESLAHQAGTHPELVMRLIGLGLVEPSGGTAAEPMFRPEDAALIARAIRLRRDLGLNYQGAVLACELLDRIGELDRQLAIHRCPRNPEVTTWTQAV